MASITIVGSGFTGATQCFFGSVGVTINLNAGGTSFTCIPPAGTGGVTLTINTSFITVLGTGDKGYTYVGSPTISSLGITKGHIAGWTPVKILGNNYYDRSSDPFPGARCGVSFGSTNGQIGFIQDLTSIYTYSPPGSTYGSVSVKVNTPTGSSNGFTFTYINPCGCPDQLDLYSTICPTATGDCKSYVINQSGCNCCACCNAICAFNPLCCESGGWYDNNCHTLIEESVNGANSQNVEVTINCKHLFYGACCVKFNSAGSSYSICLGDQGTSYECGTMVKSLDNQNSTFPWNLPHTVNFIEGFTCGECSPYCTNNTCLTSGLTCSNCSSTCCFFYGYCGTGCNCTNCPSAQ